jgi:AraC-like DNA-binding protein
MGDPHRLTLWRRLQEVAETGIAHLHQWGPDDGLPCPTPLPGHQHSVPTLILCLSGRVRVRGAREIDLGPGDLLLIEPGCWHEHVAHRAGCTSFALGFIANRCDVLFFDESFELWGSVMEQPYRTLMDELVDCARLPAHARLAEQLRLVDILLPQVVQDRATFLDWMHDGMLAMAAHMWNHLHEPISADDIIARSGLGRTTSYELFRTFFNRTPQQELLTQRLDLARHLLRRSFSVAETARRSGFTNRSELTRAYRRRFGHPPSDDVLDSTSPAPGSGRLRPVQTENNRKSDAG